MGLPSILVFGALTLLPAEVTRAEGAAFWNHPQHAFSAPLRESTKNALPVTVEGRAFSYFPTGETRPPFFPSLFEQGGKP